MQYTRTWTQTVPQPVDRVFAFFSDPGNLDLITPPWLRFRIVEPVPARLETGTRLHYRLDWRWLPIQWTTEITVWEPPRRFVDIQLRGPYRSWQHVHRFEAVGQGTRIIDELHYSLPLAWIGRLVHWLAVRRDLEAIFAYRRAVIARELGPNAPSS